MLLPGDKLPPGRREWVSLAILFLVNLLNYMDRWIAPHTSSGEQKEYHCTQVHTVGGAGGLLLGDVSRGGGRLLLHQAGAPPDRPRRGLPHGQSISCIVIYCHESCDNYCHVRTYCHIVRLLPCSATWVTATTASSCLSWAW